MVRYAYILCYAVFTLALSRSVFAAEEFCLADFRGFWKFEIGDNSNWAKADFDDSNWDEIFVPSSWEDEGFPGYDGFAWYRKRFKLTIKDTSGTIYLHLGRIDDVDEVYLNGHLVGYKGTFPPNTQTAYNIFRKYIVPPEYLNFDGENVIAIRVFDEYLAGGIVEGRPGLYRFEDTINLHLPLAGLWKFHPGDSPDWKARGYDDTGWEKISVPAYWEIQRHRDLDGFAWYRKSFYLPEDMQNQRLILILGKIDDLDETFVNGQLVGQTGDLDDETPNVRGGEWQELRAYYLPEEALHFSKKNVIAVRVFDGLLDGGIHEGPIGITTRDNYLKWRKTNQPKSKFWEMFDALINQN